jgi:formate-dependent nitrite reductase membrane component NrfD
MSREWLIGLGALLTVAGIIFALQGFGDLGGSPMTGVTLWAVIGPIAAVIGLVMVIAGFRRPAASSSGR